jgi:nucleoside diphosphate kinase
MKSERQISFMMLKPLGVEEPQRGLIINKLKSIVQIELIKKHIISEDEASKLYYESAHDIDGNPLPHFLSIVNYLTGKTVELIIASRESNEGDLIKEIDNLIGDWRPENTLPGQIRHLPIQHGIDYVMQVSVPEGSNKYCYDNLIHSSSSLEIALKEISIWFTTEDLKAILEHE